MPVKGCLDPEKARSLAQALVRSTEDLDPTSLAIIEESMQALPDAAKIRFAEAIPGLNKRGRLSDLVNQITEFRNAGMVSGFGTQAGNIIATSINLFSKPLRTLASAGVDVFAALKTGKRERFFSEAAAETYGFFRSVPHALAQAGFESRAVRENLEQVAGVQSGAIPGLLGEVVRFPLRMLNTADRFFYNIAYNGEIYRQAARQAAKEGKGLARIGQIIGEQASMRSSMNSLGATANSAVRLARTKVKGLTPEQVDDWSRATGDLLGFDVSAISPALLKKRLRSVAGTAREGIKALEGKSFTKQAAFNADRVVFTAREDELLDRGLDAVETLANNHPFFKLALNAVLPFKRTPANVARETFRGSIGGAVTGTARAIRGASAGQAVQGRLSDDLGHALVGTATMYTLLSLINNGIVKVNPYRRRAPGERITEEAAGIVPDSVQVGNWSVPVSRLEPFGAHLLAAGRLAEYAQRGENPPANVVEEALTLTYLLSAQGANETFAEPLANFLDVITSQDASINEFMQRLGASFVPKAVTQFDQKIRERESQPGGNFAGNFAEGLAKRLPGQGQAGIGLFGKEREAQAPIISVAAGRTGRIGNDPTAQEMLRVGALHMSPAGLSKDFKAVLERRGTPFSDEEDRTMRIAKGRAQELAVKRVVGSPLYQRLPQTPEGDLVRKKLIDRAFNTISREVDQRVKALKLAKVQLTERVIFGQ